MEATRVKPTTDDQESSEHENISEPCDDLELFGFEESETMKRSGRAQMDAAIGVIPDVKKTAYLEARQRCPALIESESNPIRFLRCENYNPWAAAQRLVNYWEMRKAVFGSERAFLPMDLTGEGAMLEEDMVVFKHGAFAILPNDEKNRSVMYGDRSRSPVTSARASFFLLQVLCENQASQTEGPVCLFHVNHILGAKFNRKNSLFTSRLILNGLPMKPPQVHLVIVPPDQGSSSFVEKMILQSQKRLGSTMWKATVIHVADSIEQASAKLMKYNLAKEGLPSSLGGTLDSEYFAYWQRQYGRAEPEIEDLTSLVRDSLAKFAAKKKAPPAPASTASANLTSLVRDSLAKFAANKKVPPSSASATKRCEFEDNASLVRDCLDRFSAKKAEEISAARATTPGCFSTSPGSIEAVDTVNKLGRAAKANEDVSLGATDHLDKMSRPPAGDKPQGVFPGSEVEAGEVDALRQKSPTTTRKDGVLPDLYGSPLAENPDEMESEVHREDDSVGLVQLEEALSLIPAIEKAAYLEAQQRCPALIELESSLLRFFHHENFNPWAAARRIVFYWAERKDLFGERAFLPMTLTGQGALSNEDIAVLRTGVVRLLPCDKTGRCIVFHDRSRLTQPAFWDIETRQRVFFYVMTVLTETEPVRRKGYVFMSVFCNNYSITSWEMERTLVKRSVNLVRCGFPIILRASHMVCLTENKRFTEFIIPAVVKIAASWKFLDDRTIVHMKATPKDLIEELEKYGLSVGCLPTDIGGNCGEKYFLRWLEDRALIEAGILATARMAEQQARLPARQLSEEQRRESKRKMAALYARRKRRREKIEIEVLQQRSFELAESNAKLKAENEQLEGAVGAALQAVHQIEESVSLSHRSKTSPSPYQGSVLRRADGQNATQQRLAVDQPTDSSLYRANLSPIHLQSIFDFLST